MNRKIDTEEVFHLYPINDSLTHINSPNCACLPDIGPGELGGTLVKHHSFDGRELMEGGKTAKRYMQILEVRKLMVEQINEKEIKK